QKRKDEICPFSSLAFLQPTTVDKEPNSLISYTLMKIKKNLLLDLKVKHLHVKTLILKQVLNG
ncbi:hypothetical protein, partial [Streptococcus pneumoniae]|uniref:hypothetical protein n=1 Tax=Streptococcus pneumoniae TaxID=1313 RepID=UPI001D02D166